MKNKYLEVAAVFFKLGCFAFGGPAAHIAMMESEIVHKRKWMDRQYFLDLIGATNLIPGPNSTEMTMHCGHERAGILGLFIAGITFIFPAVVITGILAWFYVNYGQLPKVTPFLYGIKPAVLAIIASAIFKLGKKALKGWELGLLGVLVLIISLLGVSEIVALLAAGVLGALYFFLKNKKSTVNSFLPLLVGTSSTNISVLALSKLSSVKVFLSFLKVGSILYGSGYVLFAYLDAELVANGLLTRAELVDAIAVGQFTPGPVLSTATFIGYQLTGFWGALMATLGIFLPSFLFVLFLKPLIPKMQQSLILRSFLDAVNIAAVAIMLGVLIKMGQAVLINWQAALILLVSFIVVFKFKKVSVMWVVFGGALLGFILNFTIM